MTELLCKWLNEEVKLSKSVESTSFQREFSNGYLFGELLQRFHLQDDFDAFVRSNTSDAKLNNFRRLEKTLSLLGVPFTARTAQEIMNENPREAANLTYQLYLALKRKNAASGQQTSTSLQAAKGAVRNNFDELDRARHESLLRHQVPRQTDIDFQRLSDPFVREAKRKEFMSQSQKLQEEAELQRLRKDRHEEMITKNKTKKAEFDMWAGGFEHLAKTHGASHPDSWQTAHRRMEEQKLQEAKTRKEYSRKTHSLDVAQGIETFERTLRKFVMNSENNEEGAAGGTGAAPANAQAAQVAAHARNVQLPRLGASPRRAVSPLGSTNAESEEYIARIKMRKTEEALARREREKRRRKVMVDQQRAQEDLEASRHESVLLARLMRQSMHERKIAAQLMQTRREKDVIRENRLFRERQYTERRQRDYEEAMRREAELARQVKQEYENHAKAERERYEMMEEARLHARYNKHYNFCQGVLVDIVDLASKVAEYTEISGNKLPPKLMREWKTLFLSSKPLYNESVEKREGSGSRPQSGVVTSSAGVQLAVAGQPPQTAAVDRFFVPIGNGVEETAPTEEDEEVQCLLDSADFEDYLEARGDWTTDADTTAIVPKAGVILGHVVHRLLTTTYPVEPPAPPPEFPAFPLRAAFIGKSFSGKTLSAVAIATQYRAAVLDINRLVDEAVQAYKAREPPKRKASGKAGEEDTAPMDMSVRADLGRQAQELLLEGRDVDDIILVKLMAEAIRSIDVDSEQAGGWILDGFPATARQAQLLEKELTGYEGPQQNKPEANDGGDKKGGAGAKNARGKGQQRDKKKKSVIVVDPDSERQTEQRPPRSGIDLVVMFSLPDNVALKRALGRRQDPLSGATYHLENDPPPSQADAILRGDTGVHGRLTPVRDASNEEAQLQQRLTAFQDEGKLLEDWYAMFKNMR
eukprot:Opistho-2@64217